MSFLFFSTVLKKKISLCESRSRLGWSANGGVFQWIKFEMASLVIVTFYVLIYFDGGGFVVAVAGCSCFKLGGLGFRSKEKERAVTGGLGPSGLKVLRFFFLIR